MPVRGSSISWESYLFDSSTHDPEGYSILRRGIDAKMHMRIDVPGIERYTLSTHADIVTEWTRNVGHYPWDKSFARSQTGCRLIRRCRSKIIAIRSKLFAGYPAFHRPLTEVGFLNEYGLFAGTATIQEVELATG